MKTLSTAFALALLAGSAMAQTIPHTPHESGYARASQMHPDFALPDEIADGAAMFARDSGHPCDTLSTSWRIPNGLEIYCNGYAYDYTVSPQGDDMVVTVGGHRQP